MMKINLFSTNKDQVNNDSRYDLSASNESFDNYKICKDTPRRLDFLILVIETLQINATDSLLLKAKDIGLSDDFTSRVKFWKMRCTNPLRITHTFTSLSSDQIDSLVLLISSMAENLYPLIRQLLSSKESKVLNKERWYLFSTRLKSLISERMNNQRSYIEFVLGEDSHQFFRELLVTLSLSCGEGGVNRLRASLYHQQ